MKGVVFSGIGAAPEVVDSLTKPTAGDEQVLVKSLWTAINPVYVSTLKLICCYGRRISSCYLRAGP